MMDAIQNDELPSFYFMHPSLFALRRGKMLHCQTACRDEALA